MLALTQAISTGLTVKMWHQLIYLYQLYTIYFGHIFEFFSTIGRIFSQFLVSAPLTTLGY